MKTNTNNNSTSNHANSIYITLQELSAMTKLWIARGEYEQAKKFIGKADDIYTSGDKFVRNIVRNIYMHSFSTLLEINGGNIAELFPQRLMEDYRQAA